MPSIHQKLEDTITEARHLSSCQLDWVYSKVVKLESNVVNLEKRTWPRKHWQVYSLPCKHSYAMILLTNISIHRYVDGHFVAADTYRDCYKVDFTRYETPVCQRLMEKSLDSPFGDKEAARLTALQEDQVERL